MNIKKSDAEQNGPINDSSRFIPLMLFLFIGSGCSALIYEIIWFQLLQLVIGSSAISLGVLLGTFMGGMCLGSLLFPSFVSPKYHPLKVYCVLELLIGVSAIALVFLLPMANWIYVDYFGGGMTGVVLRAVVCFVALSIPTLLMGATLPAIARWMETTPEGVSRMGFFYGANIAGAVFGCLLAGFFLLRLYDIHVATFTGFAINALVALLALLIAWFAKYRQPKLAAVQDQNLWSEGRWSVYLVIAMSGMSALACEVIWTRMQSLFLGATVYTFSIILAVFLVGLGIGSGIGSWLASNVARPRQALGYCQMLVIVGIAWSAYVQTQSVPYWPVDVSLTSSPWIVFQMDVVLSAFAVLPSAILWGASFPLALAAAAKKDQDPGRLVGRVYAANTIGAIVGSMLFSIVMISSVGTQRAHQIVIVVSALGALILLFPTYLVSNRSKELENITPTTRLAGVLSVPVVLVLALAGIWSIAKVPDGVIGFGRYFPTYLPEDADIPEFIYSQEGMNASIAVSKESDGVRNFHVSGKIVASSQPYDMKLQRMLGHLPAIIHSNPKSVLIVGCGAGVTSGSFVPYPDVERIVICEIEPLIPKAAGKYFGKENHNVMKDPRVEIVYDDARHFIATTNEKFDIITSDPIHPWVKGAASLYSQEYFELCKKRLNPGGIVTQWVPLYESNEEAVKSQVTTFIRAFPEGTIWGNEMAGGGYDVVLLGQVGELKINLGDLEAKLDDPRLSEAVRSMATVRFDTPIRILATYAGQGRDIEPWLDDRLLNKDKNFRLQYLAGMGINSYQEVAIYKSLLKHRKFPDNLLVDADGYFKQELVYRFNNSR